MQKFLSKLRQLSINKRVGVFLFIPIFIIILIELFKMVKKVEDTSFWDDVDNFTPDEFDENTSNGKGTGLLYMQPSFILRLDKARNYSDCSYVMNCGYRSPLYNIEIGGVKNSTHVYGLAGDINATDKEHFFQIIDGLKQAGFVRIGYYITKKNNLFIHADTSELHPQVSWYKVKGRKVTRKEFLKQIERWKR